jgi:membrane protease subunit HflC
VQNKKLILIAIVVLFSLSFVGSFVYTVDETEQVVVTQFGKYKRVVEEAGLKFKVPVLEEIHVFEKRVLEWDGDAKEIPTRDKRFIWVDSFARWRISDPLKFFQTVRDENGAHGRLDVIVNGAVRNQISKYNLIEAVRSSNRKMKMLISIEGEENQELPVIYKGRSEIVKAILAEAKPLTEGLGIELLDVRIKRVNYREDVRESVFRRMRAERERIAAKYRSEGEGEKMEILGKMENKQKEVISQAYKEAQEIKGAADAEAIKIYAEAYSKDPEFYSFMKTLESYEQNLGRNSTVILSTKSDYLKYLMSPGSPETGDEK